MGFSITDSELSDVAAWEDMSSAAPPEFRQTYRLASHRVDGALALSSRGLPLGHFNSVIGLGVVGPASELGLDRLLSEYAEAGSVVTIHVGPDSQPAGLENWLRVRGLREAGAWDRVIRGSEAFDASAWDTGAVELVTAENAAEWTGFIDRIYGLPTSPWLHQLVGRSGWSHCVLREAGVVVAARSMFISADNHAWWGIDAPVPGLMTGRFDRDFLICARLLADGLARGVHAFFTDIEKPSPERRGPAYEGFRQLGFEAAYLRRHFVSVNS